MKTEKENIDDLLKRNADEQLASFNWDRLNKSISEKLDEAGRAKAATINYGSIFKIAAGIAIAAGAIAICMMIAGQDTSKQTQIDNDGRAVVSIIENTGRTFVEINKESTETTVIVDMLVNQNSLARCEVEIIDSDINRVINENRPTWIIIRVPEPVLVDNGISRDETDLACLL